MNILPKRGTVRRYLPNPYKYVFIADPPDQEEAGHKYFAEEGLELQYVVGSWYLGDY